MKGFGARRRTGLGHHAIEGNVCKTGLVDDEADVVDAHVDAYRGEKRP